MSKWLKEPLLHFLVLGGLIFAVYNQVAGKGSAPDEIFISRGQQENLLNTFSRTWQRAPTPEEYRGLLQDYVRQEIAYRESRSLGLDREDIVIRRRLRQKLELLAEDVAGLVAPTDAELQSYLEQHPQDFALEPRLTLAQIYFSSDRRGDTTRADALNLLQEIGDAGPELAGGDYGDPLPLPARLQDVGESEVGRMFGTAFIEGLRDVEAGHWAGPVESGFGLHLVFVESRRAGRVPGLAEARDAVQRDWLSQRRREAVDGLYQRLSENYKVEIEPLVDDAGNGGDAGAPGSQ